MIPRSWKCFLLSLFLFPQPDWTIYSPNVPFPTLLWGFGPAHPFHLKNALCLKALCLRFTAFVSWDWPPIDASDLSMDAPCSRNSNHPNFPLALHLFTNCLYFISLGLMCVSSHWGLWYCLTHRTQIFVEWVDKNSFHVASTSANSTVLMIHWFTKPY